MSKTPALDGAPERCGRSSPLALDTGGGQAYLFKIYNETGLDLLVSEERGNDHVGLYG